MRFCMSDLQAGITEEQPVMERMEKKEKGNRSKKNVHKQARSEDNTE